MEFRLLFTVSISHSYYSQSCKDFSFIIPADSAQLLKNGKLMTKVLNGKLYVLFAADETGAALVSLEGKTLHIGLQLLNPFFSNFTELDFNFNSSRPLYRNFTKTDTLDAAQALVGKVFSHSLTNTERPVAVTLKDTNGQVLQTDTITATNNRSNIFYDLNGQVLGVYTVEESYSGSSKTVNYYFDNYYSNLELQQQVIFGFLEIAITDIFYTNPPEFVIPFVAKQEVLKYYILANNYTDPEITQLSVLDAGFTGEGRSQINFTKVLAAAFTADDISPMLLGNGDAKTVLFKSDTVVTRQEKSRQKIQLQKNGEVLIPHLPQPGSDKANADLIVQLAKSKP